MTKMINIRWMGITNGQYAEIILLILILLRRMWQILRNDIKVIMLLYKGFQPENLYDPKCMYYVKGKHRIHMMIVYEGTIYGLYKWLKDK